MKIVLSNGIELNPIIVTGERRYVQRESRDSLIFVFPVDVGIEALDAVFTANNCESIKIFENETISYIHKGYVIRAEAAIRSVQIEPPTDETEAVYEDRIFICMAERTEAEKQLADIGAAITALAIGEE